LLEVISAQPRLAGLCRAITAADRWRNCQSVVWFGAACHCSNACFPGASCLYRCPDWFQLESRWPAALTLIAAVRVDVGFAVRLCRLDHGKWRAMLALGWNLSAIKFLRPLFTGCEMPYVLLSSTRAGEDPIMRPKHEHMAIEPMPCAGLIRQVLLDVASQWIWPGNHHSYTFDNRAPDAECWRIGLSIRYPGEIRW